MLKGAPEGWRRLSTSSRRKSLAFGRTAAAAPSSTAPSISSAPTTRRPSRCTKRYRTKPPEPLVFRTLRLAAHRAGDDFRVGGRERVKGGFEGGMTTTFDATYHDIVPRERIVYTYEMHLDERKISVSLATLQIEPVGAGAQSLGFASRARFSTATTTLGRGSAGPGISSTSSARRSAPDLAAVTAPPDGSRAKRARTSGMRSPVIFSLLRASGFAAPLRAPGEQSPGARNGRGHQRRADRQHAPTIFWRTADAERAPGRGPRRGGRRRNNAEWLTEMRPAPAGPQFIDRAEALHLIGPPGTGNPS